MDFFCNYQIGIFFFFFWVFNMSLILSTLLFSRLSTHSLNILSQSKDGSGNLVIRQYSFIFIYWFLLCSLTLNKYALLMNPLARSIEELLPDRLSNSYCCFILLRTVLVISSVCAAFLLPFFGNAWC